QQQAQVVADRFAIVARPGRPPRHRNVHQKNLRATGTMAAAWGTRAPASAARISLRSASRTRRSPPGAVRTILALVLPDRVSPPARFTAPVTGSRPSIAQGLAR